MYKLQASKIPKNIHWFFSHLCVLLETLLLVSLLKGGLPRWVGGREHVLWVRTRLGPDHVVAGVVEVGHRSPVQTRGGEDGLVYSIFLLASSRSTRHWRRVTIHWRTRLQRKAIRVRTIKEYLEAQKMSGVINKLTTR